MEKEVMTLAEAAKRLGVSISTAYRMAESGDFPGLIPTRQSGKRRRWLISVRKFESALCCLLLCLGLGAKANFCCKQVQPRRPGIAQVQTPYDNDEDGGLLADEGEDDPATPARHRRRRRTYYVLLVNGSTEKLAKAA